MTKKKTTKLEMTRRYARLVDLLGLHPESEATAIAAKEFGVKAHQVRTYYLPKAREVVERDIGMSRREMVNQHNARLNAIYHTQPKDRLAALSQIAALWGLNAPSQVSVTVDVLYNPEDQLRAMANPAMLEKVLALDAEFEEARVAHANGDGDAGELPDGADADPGPAGIPRDPGLSVPPSSSATPAGGNGAAVGPEPEAADR